MNEKPKYIATHALLKAADIAKFLNISKSMAYRLMQTGEIPTVSIGKAKRVRPIDLHNFINASSSETNKEK
jgi:excisionase family DNA binding protein